MGFERTDAGFHDSVLSKFRTRLVTGGAEQLLLDGMLTRFHACGLLNAGGRARTVWHRGRPVDRGFQVVFKAYPRTRELMRAVGIPRRDLRPVSGGAVFVHGDGTLHRLGTSKVAALRFTGLRGAVARSPSRVIHSEDTRYPRFSALTDATLITQWEYARKAPATTAAGPC